MAIRKSLKDSENYQLVAGLDEDAEAQELTFIDDKVKVSLEESVLASRIADAITLMESQFSDILSELKITNMHLSILTDNVIDNKEIRE